MDGMNNYFQLMITLIAKFKSQTRERAIRSQLQAEGEDIPWNEHSLSLLNHNIPNCVRDVSKKKRGDLISFLKIIRGTHRQQGDLISILTRMRGGGQTRTAR
jgi:hypothetical protein